MGNIARSLFNSKRRAAALVRSRRVRFRFYLGSMLSVIGLVLILYGWISK